MKNGVHKTLSDSEWILTNGLGGYALGFGNLLNKRKYNGLLIAATRDLKRIHTLATIEERLEVENSFFYLDSNHYANCIYPSGYDHIVKSWLRPYPSVLYSSYPSNPDYLILKEIFLIQNKNAVVIKYSNMGSKPIQLKLQPKFTLRDHHFINHPGAWDQTGLDKKTNVHMFSIRRQDNGYEAYGYIEQGDIYETHTIYGSVYYPMEAIRGYDGIEDLIAPIRMDFSLPIAGSTYTVFSSAPLSNPFEEAREAEKYYKSHPLPKSHPKNIPAPFLLEHPTDDYADFDIVEYRKILDLAVRDFLINDSDIIAGYPWFGTWGRDTMISLGSFKYLPQGPEWIFKILNKYGSHLDSGLLPNTFGEGGQGLNYDSIDAPLWYVIRCYESNPDKEELFPYIANIILNFLHAEEQPFFVDHDGLIEIRPGEHAMTWMDAKIYNVPVTPRFGKPIEINALWYNALCAAGEIAAGLKLEELVNEHHKIRIEDINNLIDNVKIALQKFVGSDYLADRLENDRPVWEIRPNAVTALSLPFDFVSLDVMKKVWETAAEKLLTPYGLRSLDADHPAFKQKYLGNQKQRDMAYHQGTVWTYLLLPFVLLTIKIHDRRKSPGNLLKEISGYIWKFRNGFMKGKMSSAAEIWDGQDPYLPKGCPAQAWSTLALYEIEHILDGIRNNK